MKALFFIFVLAISLGTAIAGDDTVGAVKEILDFIVKTSSSPRSRFHRFFPLDEKKSRIGPNSPVISSTEGTHWIKNVLFTGRNCTGPPSSTPGAVYYMTESTCSYEEQMDNQGHMNKRYYTFICSHGSSYDIMTVTKLYADNMCTDPFANDPQSTTLQCQDFPSPMGDVNSFGSSCVSSISPALSGLVQYQFSNQGVCQSQNFKSAYQIQPLFSIGVCYPNAATGKSIKLTGCGTTADVMVAVTYSDLSCTAGASPPLPINLAASACTAGSVTFALQKCYA